MNMIKRNQKFFAVFSKKAENSSEFNFRGVGPYTDKEIEEEKKKNNELFFTPLF